MALRLATIMFLAATPAFAQGSLEFPAGSAPQGSAAPTGSAAPAGSAALGAGGAALPLAFIGLAVVLGSSGGDDGDSTPSTPSTN